MIQINVSQARKNFSALVNRVYLGEEYIIMVNGTPTAIMRGLTAQDKKALLSKTPKIRR